MMLDGRDQDRYEIWRTAHNQGAIKANHQDLDGINVLFFDGHVEWAGQSPQSSAPVRIHIAGQRFWWE